jgi:hypothetical protein
MKTILICNRDPAIWSVLTDGPVVLVRCLTPDWEATWMEDPTIPGNFDPQDIHATVHDKAEYDFPGPVWDAIETLTGVQ